MRVFVGGACQPELMDQDDQQIVQLVWSELQQLLEARGEPSFAKVIRWAHRMPQYHVGHVERVDEIEHAVAGLPRFELAGNAYRGVGIPFCVRSGEQATERLLATM